MFSVKSKIFNYLTSHQKSEFCKHIQIFTKKNYTLSTEEILDNLIEEESYYLEINCSRMPWIEAFINEENFLADSKKYIYENKYKFTQKEKLAPLIQKQKDYAKIQRKKVQEFKMSKDKATNRQIYYFKQLCKKYNINEQILDEEKASKLDYKNAINMLLEDREQEEKMKILNKLAESLYF
ncbi:MAG: hypothetical protein WCK67_04115 [bacterium]